MTSGSRTLHWRHSRGWPSGCDVHVGWLLPFGAVTRPPRRPEDHRVDPLLEVRERRRGKRPGDAYVRIVRPFDDVFERGGEDGGLIATERTVLERKGLSLIHI